MSLLMDDELRGDIRPEVWTYMQSEIDRRIANAVTASEQLTMRKVCKMIEDIREQVAGLYRSQMKVEETDPAA